MPVSMRALASALWLLAATSTIHAACDSGMAGRMSAKLHPGRTLDEARAACKSWPGVLGRSIVVLPLLRADAEPGVTELDLDVLVVQQADNGNTERGIITSRLFEQKVLLEDAGRIDDIRIDTTRYALAAGAPVFGLRIRYSSSSRANPYASETLLLYLQQADRLRKVIGGLEVSMDRSVWEGDCSGTFEQMRSALSTAPTRSNGFSDLQLRRTLTGSQAVVVDGGCVVHPHKTVLESTVLHYDGARYVLPAKPPEFLRGIRNQ